MRPLENAAAILAAVFLLIAMVLVCLPLSWGFRTGGYIRIEFILNRLADPQRSLILRAGLIVSAAYVAVLGWTAGKHFWSAYKTSEVMFGVIDWPVAWSWIWVPIGCALLTLRLILCTFGPASQLYGDPRSEEFIE